MSALALQQQALLGALLHPSAGAPAQAAQARLATLVHAPLDRPLAAYRANGRALAERALAGACPVVAALVGEDCLGALARTLWHRHPPRHGDVAGWGGELADWLEHEPQLAPWPYLADVARVEWALHQADRAPDAQADPASFALLAQRDPQETDLVLAPGTAVIASSWPVASLVNAHLSADPPMARVAEQLRQGAAECACVWRAHLRPRVKACAPGEAALLQALLLRQGLASALDAALAAEPGFDFSAWLAHAVGNGLVLGARAVSDAPAAASAAPAHQPPDEH